MRDESWCPMPSGGWRRSGGPISGRQAGEQQMPELGREDEAGQGQTRPDKAGQSKTRLRQSSVLARWMRCSGAAVQQCSGLLRRSLRWDGQQQQQLPLTSSVGIAASRPNVAPPRPQLFVSSSFSALRSRTLVSFLPPSLFSSFSSLLLLLLLLLSLSHTLLLLSYTLSHSLTLSLFLLFPSSTSSPLHPRHSCIGSLACKSRKERKQASKARKQAKHPTQAFRWTRPHSHPIPPRRSPLPGPFLVFSFAFLCVFIPGRRRLVSFLSPAVKQDHIQVRHRNPQPGTPSCPCCLLPPCAHHKQHPLLLGPVRLDPGILSQPNGDAGYGLTLTCHPPLQPVIYRPARPPSASSQQPGSRSSTSSSSSTQQRGRRSSSSPAVSTKEQKP